MLIGLEDTQQSADNKWAVSPDGTLYKEFNFLGRK